MVYIIIGILSVLLILAIIVIIIMVQRYRELEEVADSHENLIISIFNRIQYVNNQIHEIDYKGHFEADDEVGVIFNEIKNTIKQLDKFKGEQQ